MVHRALCDLPDCDPGGNGGFPENRDVHRLNFFSWSAAVSSYLSCSYTGLGNPRSAWFRSIREEDHMALGGMGYGHLMCVYNSYVSL